MCTSQGKFVQSRLVLILSLMIFDAASTRADIKVLQESVDAVSTRSDIQVVQDSLDTASTRADIQVHTRKQNASSTAASWSPWELTYESLSCANLQAHPWDGVKANWPKCWAKAEKDGKELSETGNCNLCDVKFEASKPEAMAGMFGSGCSATVTCAAVRVGSKACSEGHGELSAVKGLNDNKENRGKYPEKSCLPCPAGCNSCKAVLGRVTGSYRQFKCILSPKGSADGGGETCEKPEGFKCGECKKRSCSGLLPGIVKGCSTSDYKTTCDFPPTYENTVEAPATASDYTITLKAGEDKTALPPVLKYLQQPESSWA